VIKYSCLRDRRIEVDSPECRKPTKATLKDVERAVRVGVDFDWNRCERNFPSCLNCVDTAGQKKYQSEAWRKTGGG